MIIDLPCPSEKKAETLLLMFAAFFENVCAEHTVGSETRVKQLAALRQATLNAVNAGEIKLSESTHVLAALEGIDRVYLG